MAAIGCVDLVFQIEFGYNLSSYDQGEIFVGQYKNVLWHVKYLVLKCRWFSLEDGFQMNLFGECSVRDFLQLIDPLFMFNNLISSQRSPIAITDHCYFL